MRRRVPRHPGFGYIPAMTRLRDIGAALALVFLAGPASAQGQSLQNSGPTCVTGGVQYAAGEYACIPVCHGARRLARCDTYTSAFQGDRATWTYVSDACPSVMIIRPLWPNDWTQLPVEAAMTPKPVTVNLSGIAPEIAPLIGSHWN